MTNEDHLIGRADIERIQSLSEQELDQLPFGAIRLDRDGTILSYNQALYFSFICEPRMLPDLPVLTNAAEAAYGELLSAARTRTEQARA